MHHVNVFTAPVEVDPEEPAGYQAAADHTFRRFGAKRSGGRVYVLPPGEALCPYHYEYGSEEWVLVLTGTPTLRDPEGERELAPGDLVFFPEGPQGAHKLSNAGAQDARICMFSTRQDPAVIVYPDSDKIAAFSGFGRDDVNLFREDGGRDYYEREPGV